MGMKMTIFIQKTHNQGERTLAIGMYLNVPTRN